MSQKLNKVQRSWVLFDWANSAYSLVITSTIFPQVFSAFAKNQPVFLGIDFGSSETLYTVVISFSFLILVIISPILSSIADYSGKKLLFLKLFTFLGSLACVGLYFFDSHRLWIGVIGAILGSLGFSGSMVFYNAFLPEIATQNDQDELSGKGYAAGYLGSSLMLILLLLIVSFYQTLGFESELSVFKWGFVGVGIWWVAWSRAAFIKLPETPSKQQKELSHFKSGLAELRKAWEGLKSDPTMLQFLRAFFFADLGLQTLIIVAPLIAINTIGMEGSELILLVLLMQFIGIGGALVFARISKIWGNVASLLLATIIYLFICICAFFFEHKTLFYILGGLMGFSLGGMQSQARSAFSKLIPNIKRSTSFFSFYDITEKVAILSGTVLFSIVTYVSIKLGFLSGPKMGLIFLGICFLIALILWLPLKREAKRFK